MDWRRERKRGALFLSNPAAGKLMSALVQITDKLGAVAGNLPLLDPLATALAPHRSRAVRQLATLTAERARRLERPLLAGDKAAIEDFDELAANAVEAFRRTYAHGARKLVSAFDRRLFKNSPELLDDPNFPMGERVAMLQALDQLNSALGSYARWATLIDPLIQRAESTGSKPVRIIDIASGHAGFALWLKERWSSRVAITATDIAPEYLGIGRAEAARRGLHLEFRVVDATALGAATDLDADIVMCTQSLHHFSPGMIARMLGEAARAAKIGVCFIDIDRAVLPLVAIPPLMAARTLSYPAVHDTWVSLRRMLSVEELELLGAIAPGIPGGCTITAGRMAPGFCYVATQKVKAPPAGRNAA